MELISGLFIGLFIGLFARDMWHAAFGPTQPRVIVVGSSRYFDAVQRERNAEYGKQYQEATEAAQAAKGWRA